VDSTNIKAAGLKITLPRRRILELLEKSEAHHLRAEDIYRMLTESGEEIGLATVYRVLTQFEAAGLVVRHYFEGGQSVFELNHGTHHDHLVCVKCGMVKEFVDKTIEARQEQIAKEAGYTITDHCLNIYGLCKDCQK
jgi:Fur family transcriptional regulator, ferric uptake regulator